MSFRCYNEPWLKYVEKWAFFIMDVVRPYLAENGGPIILSQVENVRHYYIGRKVLISYF